MPDAALVLGVTGILTSGVVGPWVGNRFSAQRQRREFAHEQTMADRGELRGLLDDAAVALHKASYARGDAETAILSHGATVGEEAPDLRTTMTDAGEPLDALRERIYVRLGRHHPVADAFRQADEAFLELFQPVMYICNYGSDEHVPAESFVEIKAASAFESRRTAFVDVAAGTVGSRLDEGGSAPRVDPGVDPDPISPPVNRVQT